MLSITPHLGVTSRLLLGIAFPAALAFSQTGASPGRSDFEVASVKPNASTGGEAYVQVVPGRPSTAGSCVPYHPDAPPPLAPEPGQPRPNFCDYPHLGRQGRNRTLDGKGLSIPDIARVLARVELHRPVIDRTDLTGTFDVHLEWTPDLATGTVNVASSDGPSIFTALREQLGLKLDSSRALSEMIVIDRIERPSAN